MQTRTTCARARITHAQRLCKLSDCELAAPVQAWPLCTRGACAHAAPVEARRLSTRSVCVVAAPALAVCARAYFSFAALAQHAAATCKRESA
eukprot:6212705-Pleurochrysis_carterae.AAC.2